MDITVNKKSEKLVPIDSLYIGEGFKKGDNYYIVAYFKGDLVHCICITPGSTKPWVACGDTLYTNTKVKKVDIKIEIYDS